MAFVLVQHLDPGHDSILAELLTRDAKMPVTQVENEMPVEPNRVYVIPPNANMALFHGRLSLMERQPGLNMPVDYFFHSLAQELGERAMGVVLSGTGTDGSRGVAEIKAENGVTFAQDSQTADYEGMPEAAVASGAVDFVMPPEQISEVLVKVSRHPFLSKDKTPAAGHLEARGKEDALTKIFILLRDRTGADFALYKRSTLERRITRRMIILKIEALEDYVSLLEGNPAEVDQLFQDILIHVTSFFREPEVFELLKKTVLPEIMKHKSTETPVRIWVPGCSTGEEVYSIAIALAEFSAERRLRPAVQIFATDLNDKALEQARDGIYSDNALGGVSGERLSNYFTRTKNGYQVTKFIRDMCIFAKHDISRNPPFSHMDLISFRNVLIYMKRVLQHRIIPTLNYALEPWGFLLLGTSEHIGDFPELFRIVDKKYTLFSKNPASERLTHLVSSAIYHPGNIRPSMGAPPTTRGEQAQLDPQREANSVILARYAPPGVLINDEMQVIQFRGDVGRYMTPAPGRASFDLLAMAREGLSLEIRTAIDRAKKSFQPVSQQAVRVKMFDEFIEVNLEVLPFKSSSGETYYWVLFEEIPRGVESPTAKAKVKSLKQPEAETEADRLRTELLSAKQYLQSLIEEKEEINEELRAANEEVQSSNEELLSINEELETAKEELQSSNEELTTLNEELQNRNLELTLINDDLFNVQNSVGVPMIILTNDLKIRRVTPAAEKMLKISGRDVGRCISDIPLFVGALDLAALASDVIRSVTPIEKEVVDANGRRFNLEMRPYKTGDNRIDGSVVTAIDVTDLKRSLEISNLFLETARVLAKTLDLDTLQASLIRFIQKLVPGGHVAIELIDSEGGYVQAISGIGSPSVLHRKLDIKEISPIHYQILSKKKPIIVAHDSGDADYRNVSTSESRTGVMLYQPIILYDSVIGNIAVDFPDRHYEFSDRDLELLEGVAAQAAIAFENARLYTGKENIVEILESALLSRPAEVPGIESGYLFESATKAANVGGDFYDVFALGAGRAGIIIGDVSGKGINAASFSARAKQTLKAYAYEFEQPALVLAKTNKVLCKYTAEDNFVTIFFGTLDTNSGLLSYCSGGHPPALIAGRDGRVEILEASSLIVGAFPDAEYEESQATIRKGDRLVFYTDGVIEAKGPGSELFGLQRLIDLVKPSASLSPDDVTTLILSRINDFTSGALSDDIAIMIVALQD